MKPVVHRIYIGSFVLVGVLVFAYLLVTGLSYYNTPLEERFYHDDHTALKASGIVGHGLGIIGTLMIVAGVAMYMARKRIKRFRKVGVLKYWLEFHIFLCSVGPILVLFHTSFKFGGIVSISFWSMVAVVLSGIIGRFIYIQIPRTIQGRELSLAEIHDIRADVESSLQESGVHEELAELSASRDDGPKNLVSQWFADMTYVRNVHRALRPKVDSKDQLREIMKLVREEVSLTNRIRRLQQMQRLFKYWHVAHLPFALIMLIIMIIHVGVTLTFGYKWIF